MHLARKALAATLVASVALAAGLVAASPASAATTSQGSSTGTGSVLLVFHNLEGSTPGVSNRAPAPDDALGYRGAPGTGPRMYLSDDVLSGSFAMNFFLTHRDVAQFDRFKVRNTGNVAITMVYTSETEYNVPSTPVDDGQLLVCFLQGCDVGFFVPDSAAQPPIPLLTLAPGEEAIVQVGLKLAPNADWAMWNNRLRLSFLHFEAQAA